MSYDKMFHFIRRNYVTLKPVPIRRRGFKRPPTDMKYVLSLKKNVEYETEDEKWFPKRLQSFEEWPEELKDKINDRDD